MTAVRIRLLAGGRLRCWRGRRRGLRHGAGANSGQQAGKNQAIQGFENEFHGNFLSGVQGQECLIPVVGNGCQVEGKCGARMYRRHGAAVMGIAPSVPGLLGLPRDYVIGQLGAWRTGLRKTLPPDCMGRIALTLTREDVLAVSTWLASQPVPVGAKPAAPATTPLPMACGSATR